MMTAQRITTVHPLETAAFMQFRERLRQKADLSRTNWFRVGGPAEWLFKPESVEDLSAFLAQLPLDIPVTVLGVGSNVIVRDGGIDGVVIKLGRGFVDINVKGDRIEAGGGALDLNVALVASDAGIADLEFFSGIPGTIGGAVRMNGGAYGSDTASVLIEADIVLRNGTALHLPANKLGFGYRQSNLPPDAIVMRALLQGRAGNREEIRQRIQTITSTREQTQPVRARTGGSTFKNPEGYKAWELIERSGCRGLKIGGAEVSEKHCNFLINTGEATAADLENLGEEVRRRVHEKTGITLEWEIRRLGKAING
jgi:UDP-N-acetylmuramate dehydrogenase